MSKVEIIRQLQAYKKNPDRFREPSTAAIVELVLPILHAVETIDKMLKEGRLDGKTPVADEDYLSYTTAAKQFRQLSNKFFADVDERFEAKSADLEKRIKARLDELQDGEDGIVSDEEIARAAQLAYDLIKLPDFDKLISERLTANPEAVRDALELTTEEKDKLSQSAIQNLPEDLKQLQNQIAKVYGEMVGGVGTSRNVIDQVIRQRIADGTIPGGSGPGAGVAFETPTGAVNSSNTSFDVANEPLYVVIEGVQFFEGVGYSYAAGTITTDLPPTSFIRSAYSS